MSGNKELTLRSKLAQRFQAEIAESIKWFAVKSSCAWLFICLRALYAYDVIHLTTSSTAQFMKSGFNPRSPQNSSRLFVTIHESPPSRFHMLLYDAIIEDAGGKARKMFRLSTVEIFDNSTKAIVESSL